MKKIGVKNTKVKYVILFMIIFSSSLTYSPITSYACSCAGPITVEEQFEQSSTVFSGKVVEIVDKNKRLFNLSSAGPIAVKFEVEESWKGINQTEITVYTERSSASCGYEFKLDTEYLVYANEDQGVDKVNRCSRTAPLLTAEKDITELGQGEKPNAQALNVIEEPLEEAINNNEIYIILLILGLILVVVYRSKRLRK